MAGALSDFWGIKGHFTEGRRRLRSALRADERPTAARAKALNGAADLATAADVESARLWVEEALSIHRQLGDQRGIAESVLMLGSSYEGDWERARGLWEESVRRFSELGDRHYAMLATRLLAWSYSELGDPARALALHEENLGEARATGDEHIEAQSLEAIAHLSVTQGRPLEAVPMLERAYEIHHRLGDPFRLAIAVGRFARVVASTGSAETAAMLLSCSEALFEEIGASAPWVLWMNEETLATVRTQLDETAIAEARERGRTLTADEAVALALKSWSEPSPVDLA
jgi:non-specific serine/threonine protein kinase